VLGEAAFFWDAKRPIDVAFYYETGLVVVSSTISNLCFFLNKSRIVCIGRKPQILFIDKVLSLL
jgi:hypothetical protein